jgi:hypothetical protein
VPALAAALPRRCVVIGGIVIAAEDGLDFAEQIPDPFIGLVHV